jgi:hypothetical protein
MSFMRCRILVRLAGLPEQPRHVRSPVVQAADIQDADRVCDLLTRTGSDATRACAPMLHDGPQLGAIRVRIDALMGSPAVQASVQVA